MRKTIVIGTGPAGLTAAIYLARANMQPLVIEGPEPGGQLTTATEVENFPGFPDGILGPELMDNMRKQAERFGAEFMNGWVNKVDLGKRPFTLEVEGHGTLQAETLIVSTGASAKLLGIPGEKENIGRGVSTCATCDGFFFRNKKLIVVGGGGIGESPRSTARIDVIDLKEPKPRYTPGPELPAPTRYPNVVQLPDDTVLISNGSRDYRAKGASWNYTASIYHPDTNTLTPAADPSVGRDYHAEGILLPTGQVMTLGGQALFRDKDNTKPAQFEKRLEIFTPAYLFRGERPTIADAPSTVGLGETMTVATPDADRIAKARLIKPGASTHVTDLEQRSVALDIEKNSDGTLELTVPKEDTIALPGFYMLFLVDDQGVPSVAKWVQVTR